ncbi:14032_t:CDS:10 [Gigaspora rosea]|nr:14032_t:CDS:10 [Gigaspora rosea]
MSSEIHEYFNRKSSEWNISDFLRESKEEPFQRRIDRYFKSLETIIDHEEGKLFAEPKPCWAQAVRRSGGDFCIPLASRVIDNCNSELSKEQTEIFIRNSAGLALKNSLVSSEASRRYEITQRWLNMVLATLGSSDQRAAATAAQSEEEPFQRKIDRYFKSLETIIDHEEGKLFAEPKPCWAQAVRQSGGVYYCIPLASRVIDNCNSEASRRYEITQRWLNMVLATLGSSDQRAAATAAQVVLAIATIELPTGQWTDLMKTLLGTSTTDNSQLKIVTLTAIGFVCESIDSDILAAQSGAILTVVVSGARKEEPKCRELVLNL